MSKNIRHFFIDKNTLINSNYTLAILTLYLYIKGRGEIWKM